MQAIVIIFGVQVDNDVLYGGIANQPTPAYSSLYVFNFFLDLDSLSNKFTVTYTSQSSLTSTPSKKKFFFSFFQT